MMSGVSIVCFAASYAVTLLLEVSRLFFRARIRHLVMLGFAAAGLIAHSIYLYNLAQRELAAGAGVFATWYDWCLLATWFLAAMYLGLAARRPHNTVGLFLLPLVIGLVGAALLFRNVAPEPFPRERALRTWIAVHAGALLLATVSMVLGFATGVMYLVQVYRLKHKLPPRQGLRLPSLEWLRRCSQETLFLSTWLLAAGFVSGVVLNLHRTGHVDWTDPVVFGSAGLFLWLAAALGFEWAYRPAREGHKVAYLTIASLVFLTLVIGLALARRHATSGEASAVLGRPSELRLEALR